MPTHRRAECISGTRSSSRTPYAIVELPAPILFFWLPDYRKRKHYMWWDMKESIDVFPHVKIIVNKMINIWESAAKKQNYTTAVYES
jgi:hypothetical protein